MIATQNDGSYFLLLSIAYIKPCATLYNRHNILIKRELPAKGSHMLQDGAVRTWDVPAVDGTQNRLSPQPEDGVGAPVFLKLSYGFNV